MVCDQKSAFLPHGRQRIDADVEFVANPGWYPRAS